MSEKLHECADRLAVGTVLCGPKSAVDANRSLPEARDEIITSGKRRIAIGNANPSLNALKDLPSWQWPKNARETLLAVLRDPKAGASDRLLACRLAGDETVMDERLVGTLLAVLRQSDESDEIRGQAAISLGPLLEWSDMWNDEDALDEAPDFEFGGPRVSGRTIREAVDALRAIYEDADAPKLVRRRALEASVRLPQDWHAEAVRAAYASCDPEWRLTAVFAMRWIQGFGDEIVEALASSDTALRCEAALSAGEWAIDAAWPYIKQYLSSGATEKPLIFACIEAASLYGTPDAVFLLTELTDDKDPEIASAAEEGLLEASMMSGHPEVEAND